MMPLWLQLIIIAVLVPIGVWHESKLQSSPREPWRCPYCDRDTRESWHDVHCDYDKRP